MEQPLTSLRSGVTASPSHPVHPHLLLGFGSNAGPGRMDFNGMLRSPSVNVEPTPVQVLSVAAGRAQDNHKGLGARSRAEQSRHRAQLSRSCAGVITQAMYPELAGASWLCMHAI